jgi:hypothetical protein
MPDTWNHPSLGRLAFVVEWTGAVDVPAFQAYQYGVADGDATAGKAGLTFYADDEDDTPSPAASAVATTTIANQAALAAKVADALWADFTGQGPTSGMWWHNRLEKVAAALADVGLTRPAGPADVPALLRLRTIYVHSEADGYDPPLVELKFAAAFEDEHGVGVLTDGADVLGIGYCAGVALFSSAR